MKGTSKVMMGATLVMVVSLAIVLGLVLVLLAELYCSLLLSRRRPRATATTTPTTATATTTPTTTAGGSSSQSPQLQDQSVTSPPPTSFSAQGVIRAPRSFFFPSVSTKQEKMDIEKQKHTQLLHILESETQESKSLASSPTPSLIQVASPQPEATTSKDTEHLIYISNPIYDNEARPSQVGTPFETPDTSPSRLEMSGSSGDDEDNEKSQVKPTTITPPLSPMKKLPAEACSVSLKEVRSLGTSGSDSNSHNGVSSSSSGSPRTSPSW